MREIRGALPPSYPLGSVPLDHTDVIQKFRVVQKIVQLLLEELAKHHFENKIREL